MTQVSSSALLMVMLRRPLAVAGGLLLLAPLFRSAPLLEKSSTADLFRSDVFEVGSASHQEAAIGFQTTVAPPFRVAFSGSGPAAARAAANAETLCEEDLRTNRWGWWGTGAAAGTSFSGTVEVSDPTVLGIALSGDGPFVDKLNITFTTDDQGIAWAPPIVKKGLKKGSSSEKYSIGPPISASWAIQWNIIGFGAFSVKEINSPLDMNPGPAGGSRIFPDRSSPSDNADRRSVRVEAIVDPPIAGVEIMFRAFDVDDPTGTSANRGGCGAFVSSIGCTAFLRTDGTGSATDDFQVTMFPGDNFRLAAACSSPYLTAVTVRGTDLIDQRGKTLPTGQAGVSDLITVWRDLHIEVDEMQPVVNNVATATVLSVTNSQARPEASFKLNVTYGGPALDVDQYAGGTLFTYDSQGKPLQSFPVLSNRSDVIVVSTALPLQSPTFVGGYAELIDDDDYDGNADGKGDIGEALVTPAAVWSLVQDGSSDAATNLFARAYYRLKYDGGGNPLYNQKVPFITNVPKDRRGVQATSVILASRQAVGADDYWVAYRQIAYQGDRSEDNDPIQETALGGTTPYIGISNRLGRTGVPPPGGIGSFVFLETLADAIREDAGRAACLQVTVPHELGHQLGIAGDRKGDRTMDDSVCDASGFIDDHLAILRSRVKSPGQP